MKKVLLVKEKHCYRVFNISTPELLEKAYLTLFEERNKEGYYSDLVEMRSELWVRAKKGDGKVARELINLRSHRGYEYEDVEEINVE